jgi:muramoyltetrapeptide carboxypeptidase
MLTKPERLESGDHVGIFVPSSPVKIHYRDQGQKQIRKLGYVPVEVEEILSKKHLVAKHPDENLNDIQKFFSQREIKALWAARGGYGSNYLLPMLEKLEIPEPKIVIGSSDVSYLLWYLLDKRKMIVFYGPMVYSTLAENRADLNSLKSVLPEDAYRILYH